LALHARETPHGPVREMGQEPDFVAPASSAPVPRTQYRGGDRRAIGGVSRWPRAPVSLSRPPTPGQGGRGPLCIERVMATAGGRAVSARLITRHEISRESARTARSARVGQVLERLADTPGGARRRCASTTLGAGSSVERRREPTRLRRPDPAPARKAEPRLVALPVRREDVEHQALRESLP